MINLLKYIKNQSEWSKKVFGKQDNWTPIGLCNHIRKELDEIEKDPCDVFEWIDVVILALDGAWRCGATPEEVIKALVTKQEINFARKWGKPDEQGVMEHIKGADPEMLNHIKTTTILPVF